MDVVARLEALQAENERLREQLTALEAAFGLDLLTPIEWRLTGQECRLFGALMGRPLLTKDAAMAALYRDRGAEEPEIKIVDVFVCTMRAKLKPFEIEVATRWGEGYFLTPATKAAVQLMLDGR